jgi:hypothetical protein
LFQDSINGLSSSVAQQTASAAVNAGSKSKETHGMSERTAEDLVIMFSVLGLLVLIAVVIGLLNLFGYQWPERGQTFMMPISKLISRLSRRRREYVKDTCVIEKGVEHNSYSELEAKDRDTSELWTVSNVAELEGSTPVPPKKDDRYSPQRQWPRKKLMS